MQPGIEAGVSFAPAAPFGTPDDIKNWETVR
jgi:hypothetical protein